MEMGCESFSKMRAEAENRGWLDINSFLLGSNATVNLEKVTVPPNKPDAYWTISAW